MTVTVAIIARDEEQTIEGVVRAARPFAGELLVVDGGSRDRTAALARQAGAAVISDNGRGKGDGVRTAIARAGGEVLVLMDADGSHVARDIPELAAPVAAGQAEMVIGSRLRGGSDEFHGTLDNVVRQVGGTVISWMLQWRWRTEVTDCENGFRAVSVPAARRLRLTADDFLIEQELTIRAIKAGWRIREVPSHELARQGGQSKLKTSLGWKFLWHLAREMTSG
ncbi:MAG TPA: glycosyltransferase family 2 protein [Candidatus Edwardsbacteria bacterium]|nr:glycosyltransferase family 2 protein [Candidatus Edwardsbacteria bacterium]